MKTCKVLTLLALHLVFAPVSEVQALDRYWSCTSSYWDISSCWNPVGIPQTTDNIFLQNIPFTDTTLYIDTLVVTADAYNLDIDSTGSSVTLGQTGGSTLTIANDLTMGVAGGAGPTFYIMSGSNLLVGNNEVIGGTGTSSFTQNGGTHSVTNTLTLGGSAWGNGTLSVNDAGTLSTGPLNVGDVGTGTLNINEGSSVTSSSGSLGSQTGSDGIVRLLDAGSTWTNSDSLYVGGNSMAAGGSGLLTVNRDTSMNVANMLKLWNGGTVTLNGGSITTGSFDSSLGTFNFYEGTLTVNGSSGTFTDGNVDLAIDDPFTFPALALVNGASANYSTGNAYIGGAGLGILDLNSGGSLSNVDGYVGRDTGSIGMVTVASSGAWSNSGSLYLGGDALSAGGAGTLNVDTGGIVDAGNLLKIWGPGTLNLNGGTINLADLDSEGSFNFTAGTLNFTNNLLMDTSGPLGNSFIVSSLQTLGVSGTTTLNGASALYLDGGAFSTGSLVNSGGFTFYSGTFNLTGDNLTIGSGELFGSLAQFNFGQTTNVSNLTTVDSDAILSMNGGTLTTGSLTNNGLIQMNGSFSSLGGGILTNSGEIAGDGRINMSLFNHNTGEVRVGSGESLRMTSAGNFNIGRIEVIGGEVEFDQDLINQGGSIFARNATLRFSGGLNNQGGVGLSFGVSDVFGDINNNGTIVQSGGGQVTFFDDIINNGVVQTSAGSQAVFFGAVSGAGSYTGTGSLFFEGDLGPGNSPALVNIGGDMSLGLNSHTIMEIAGLTRGSEYDAFNIGGTLSLGGELDIALYDMGSGLFNPEPGDSFDLFMADTILGDFDLLTLAILGIDLGWQLDFLTDAIGTMDVVRLSVVASAVPVPPAVWLFGTGLLGLVAVARRRQRH